MKSFRPPPEPKQCGVEGCDRVANGARGMCKKHYTRWRKHGDPGFTLNDCSEIYGDEIERTVEWDSQSDLSQLAGQAVRLRFVMKDADLYSLRFRL